MIKLDVRKEDVEIFFDSLKSDFDKIRGKKRISFKKFKEYFCDDNLFLNSEGGINNYICKNSTCKKINNYICKTGKCKKLNKFKSIYKNISSSDTTFYKKIRNFIIEKFTEKIKFCPYCGKVPLIYFEKEDNSYRRLFQLDHFFPKNVYHRGIINFYNLIPSCNACNHLKGDENPLDLLRNGGKIFHPYFGFLSFENNEIQIDNGTSFDENYTFLFLYDERNNIYDSTHSKYFKLAQKYFNSEDTFNTFDFIWDKLTKIKDERMKFKNSSKSIDEFKDYFFKNYYPEKEQYILKYSNGKLKKDLIEGINL